MVALLRTLFHTPVRVRPRTRDGRLALAASAGIDVAVPLRVFGKYLFRDEVHAGDMVLLFGGDGAGGAPADAVSASAVGVVDTVFHEGAGRPRRIRKRKVGDYRDEAPGAPLFGDERIGEAERPQSGDIGGMPLRPVAGRGQHDEPVGARGSDRPVPG